MQVLKKGFTLVLGLAMILSSTALVFADEPSTGGDKVTLKVIVGENGKVNDKTGEWTQELTKQTTTQTGQTLDLHVVADDGYVFDKSYTVDTDGIETEEAESSTNSGKSDFHDTVPALEDNLTLKYTFKAKSDSTTPSTEPSTDPSTDPSTTTDPEYTFSWTINDTSLGSVVQTMDISQIDVASGSVKYKESLQEEQRRVSILAKDNAVIEKVVVNGEEQTSMAGKAADNYTLTKGDVTMEVTFKAIGDSSTGQTFKIETKAGPGGSITPTIESYADGTEQTIVWTSDAGYVIESVKIDGVEVTENVGIGTFQGTTKFTTGNHSVEVTFKADTEVKTEDGEAGNIELIANTSYVVGQDFNIQVVFTPASTEYDTEYVFESSDWEIVSNDKGTKDGKKITGVIPKGTEKETFNVVLKPTNVKSRFTVTFTQNGKTSSTYGEAVGYDDGETVDLSDGILGILVDGDFYAYTSPTGQNDEYFQSMTMLTAKPTSEIKVAIQKDDQIYEAAEMEVTGITEKKASFTGQEVFDAGTEVTVEGLEFYNCFTFGATFDSKYTVPTELAASGMQALISLEDEDEEVDEDDGALDEDEDSDSSGTVKTGDETNMPLYASAMFMSMILLGTLLLRRRVMNN